MQGSDQWTELVSCPNCGMTGAARLSKAKKGAFDFRVEAIPAGFSRLEFCNTFFCGACDQPAHSHRTRQ